MIPKIIHYCWFGGNPLPEKARECIESWKKNCPDYEIREWNESNFAFESHPYMKQAMEMKAYAFVSDVARLTVLKEYGGIYLDTDVKILRNLDDLLELGGFAGLEKGWPCRYGRHYDVATGLGLGAEANHPVIRAMLAEYDGVQFIKPDGKPDKTPCPKRNTAALKKLGYVDKDVCQDFRDFRVFSSEYFCPMDYITGKTRITKKTYSIHLYGASWREKKDAKKYRIAAFRCSRPVMFCSRLAANILHLFGK